MSSPILIRRGDVTEVLDLRWRILRAGLPRESANFDGDTEETAWHFVAERDGRIVGCLTMLRRTWLDKPAWQLRGMAVDETIQRSGIGRLLLEAVERTALEEDFSRQLWCNARSPAMKFYKKLGWELASEEFVIPTAGPHYKMTKLLKS